MVPSLIQLILNRYNKAERDKLQGRAGGSIRFNTKFDILVADGQPQVCQSVQQMYKQEALIWICAV